jgi:hypothetical protein
MSNNLTEKIESLLTYNLAHVKPQMDLLSGGFEPDETKINHPLSLKLNAEKYIHDKYIIEIRKLLDEQFIIFLKKLMKTSNNFEQVSVQGRKDNPTDEIGSLRTTMWSEKLANYFSALIIPNLPDVIKTNSYSPTDCWQDINATKWKPVQVSPLLRFMEYTNGGQHYTHYDAGFIYPDKIHRTLYSFVAYLTYSNTGATRFIKDKQMTKPTNQRNHDDWDRESLPNEIYRSFFPIPGNVVLFPHRLAHDVSKFTSNRNQPKRIIIRGDIIFKALDAK